MSTRHLPVATMAIAFLVLHALPATATSHASDPTAVEVTAKAMGDTLPETLVDKIRVLPGVGWVEKYLLVPGEQNDKIGIEPGAPVRIFTAEGQLIEGKVEYGRGFRETDVDANVALVNRVPEPPAGHMAAMVHYFGVGQSFVLNDTRLRIVGEVVASTERKIFLPLATAQRLYGKEGAVTHFFVSVEAGGRIAEVQRAVTEALGPDVAIERR